MAKGFISSKRLSRRQIRTAMIIAGCFLVVLLIGFGVWTGYSKTIVFTQEKAKKINNEITLDLADQVSQNFVSATKILSTLATDENTIAVFESSDDEALLKESRNKIELFSNALAIRYIRPRAYAFDENLISELGWASIELLKKSANKSNINAQAQLSKNNKNKLDIVLVKSVFNSDYELIGLLHLTLDEGLLQKIMNGVKLPDDSYIELIQPSADKKTNLILAKVGVLNTQNDYSAIANVSETLWSIAYWAPNSELSNGSFSPISIMFIIIFLLLLVMAWVGLIFISRKKQINILSDISDLFTSIAFFKKVLRATEAAYVNARKKVPSLSKIKNQSSPDTENQPSNKQGEVVGTNVTSDNDPVSEKETNLSNTNNQPPKKLDLFKALKKTNSNKQGEVADSNKQDEVADSNKQDEVAGSNDLVPKKSKSEKMSIDPIIFRAYDIRGIVGETLTENVIYKIGFAIASKAKALEQQTIVVGRDGRNSSPKFSEALINGLRQNGQDVIDIGMVPTPLLYFATYHLKTASGVMITGSHNRPEYNGLKIMLAGNTLSGDDIQELQNIAMSDQQSTGQEGELHTADIAADYIRRVTEDIQVSLNYSLNIVIDCGNGVAGEIAPRIFKALGHKVTELYCEVDGHFPNHHPDPSQPENLQALIDKVKQEKADVGFAFDGDGDRLGLVDADGNIIWPDRQMMLLAQDVLSRNQGSPIIFDVKCSRHLQAVIEQNKGQPLMWKTGHSFIKNKMKEVDAPLAGEMSGHIFFKERWYGFDDALYTAARLIEIFTNKKIATPELFSAFPESITTPELRLAVPEKEHTQFMQALTKAMPIENAQVIDIDGLRIEYNDGWGLARPSNTSPYITLRFEGDNETAIERIKSDFRVAISKIKTDAKIPF